GRLHGRLHRHPPVRGRRALPGRARAPDHPAARAAELADPGPGAGLAGRGRGHPHRGRALVPGAGGAGADGGVGPDGGAGADAVHHELVGRQHARAGDPGDRVRVQRAGRGTAQRARPAEDGAVIEVRDLEVRYGGRLAARVPELVVGPGECVAIVGESGSGTSTPLPSLPGLTDGAGASGRITVAGVDVTRASAAELRAIRGARVALVMQSPQAALSPTTRLGTLMRRALKLHGVGDAGRVMTEAVEAVLLDPAILRRYP